MNQHWICAEAYLLQQYGNAHHDPAQGASDTVTYLDVGLDEQEDDGTPEDDLKEVDNCVCLVTSPLAELLDMFRYQLIPDEDQTFGSLARLSDCITYREVNAVLTMPKAIVFALVRG